jgi:hypothetical protein
MAEEVEVMRVLRREVWKHLWMLVGVHSPLGEKSLKLAVLHRNHILWGTECELLLYTIYNMPNEGVPGQHP